jgi:peptidyl-prolyl cis-trans isomerase D
MLQAIRSRAGSAVVKALFALLIVTFGVWGIGDIFRNRPTDTAVAAVDGHSIDANALQTALQPALERLSLRLGSPVDLHQAKRMGIVDAVLGELIDNSLLDRQAQQMQLDVSDSVVRDAITQDPMFRGADGSFDRNAFEAMLAANHMTEAQYVDRVRREVPREDLLIAVTAGVAPPAPIVDRLYRYRNEKRVAEIVTMPDSGVGEVGQPSEAELKAFYEAHQDLFRAPEYRGFTLASLTPAAFAQKIQIPEAKLKSAYEQRQDEFVLPERRQLQQILAPSEDKAKAAEAALGAGKDWTEIARTIAGQDPQTIDLGLLKREELPKNLGDAAFALPPGKPSQPIKTPLGWHILRVVRIVPPTTQTFDEAKAKLTADLAQSAAVDRLYTVANHVDDAIAGGATLGEAATQFGLNKTVFPAVDDKGAGRDDKRVALPVAPAEVLKLAFSTEEGRTSRVIQAADGSIFVLHLDKVIPPTVRPLAEVRDKAVAAWQDGKRKDMAAKEATSLATEVNPGADLATLAAAKGLKAVTSPPFQRQADAAAGVPSALVEKLFAAKPGGVVTATDGTGSYVAQLTKIEEPRTAMKGALQDLSREVASAIRADLGAEYTRALRARFPIEIHREMLDRLF